MKKRLLAVMSDNGKYLSDFEPNDGRVLAYKTNWQRSFEHALKVDWDAIKDDEENTKKLKLWADSVGGKLVIIEMDYQVTELETGEEREEYVDRIGNALKDIFDALTTDDIDELDEEDMEDIYG